MEENWEMENSAGETAESGLGTESSEGGFLEGFLEEEPTAPLSEDPDSSEETADRAESGSPEENEAETVGFVEHGQKYFVNKRALSAFAGAVGKKPEEVIELYQKGCGFDGVSQRLSAAKEDSDLISACAHFAGLSENAVRERLSEILDKAPVAKRQAEILTQNPGLSEEDAERFALAEVGQENARREKISGKIREIDAFMERHPAVSTVPEPVRTAFENGTPLEDAYENWMLRQQVEALKQELFEAETGKAKADRADYARTHSAGSAKSAVGTEGRDLFLEGLFGK